MHQTTRWIHRFLRFAGLACGLSLGLLGAAMAQGYPNKPIRLIAPFAAGGAADTVARQLAPKLSQALGQTVIVENRPGAGGAIGSAFVAAAPADGYTLLVNLGPPHQTIQLFSKGVNYDPVKDFTAVAKIAVAPQALVVPANSPFQTIKDLLDESRSNAKGLSFGTSGAGTSQHLAGLMLGITHKAKLTHVPYRGGSAALTDVLSGQVDFGILVLSNVLPHVQSGKLRLLGLVDGSRSASAPSLPTLAESGLSGFSVPDTWVGLLGPKGLPAPITQRLSAEVEKISKDPEFKAKMELAGYDIRMESSDAFAKQLFDSAQLYKNIVTQAGIVPE